MCTVGEADLRDSSLTTGASENARFVLSGRPGQCGRQRSDEAVAAARHGNQVALSALPLVQCLPERRSLDLEVVLLDDLPRPDPRQQLILGDDISPGGGQHGEDVESPAAEPHRNSVARQFPPREVEPKSAECYLFAAHRPQPVMAANSEHFSS